MRRTLGRSAPDARTRLDARHATRSSPSRRADLDAWPCRREGLPLASLPCEPRAGRHRGRGHAFALDHGGVCHVRLSRGGSPGGEGPARGPVPSARAGPSRAAAPSDGVFRGDRHRGRVVSLRPQRRLGAAWLRPHGGRGRGPCAHRWERLWQVDASRRRCGHLPSSARPGEKCPLGSPGVPAAGPQDAPRLSVGGGRAHGVVAYGRLRPHRGGRHDGEHGACRPRRAAPLRPLGRPAAAARPRQAPSHASAPAPARRADQGPRPRDAA